MFFDIVFYLVLLLSSYSVRFLNFRFLLSRRIISGLIPLITYLIWLLFIQYYEQNNGYDLLNSYFNLDGKIYLIVSSVFFILSYI